MIDQVGGQFVRGDLRPDTLDQLAAGRMDDLHLHKRKPLVESGDGFLFQFLDLRRVVDEAAFFLRRIDQRLRRFIARDGVRRHGCDRRGGAK